MTDDRAGPTPQDNRVLASSAATAPAERYVIVDGSTGKVITPTVASLPDILRGIRFRRASNDASGTSITSKGRRLMRAERRRAYLEAIRSSKRVSGQNKARRIGKAPSAEGGDFVGMQPSLIAGLMAEGHIAPRSESMNYPDLVRAATPASSGTSPDDAASDPVAPPVRGSRSAVSDFEAEADRLSLPLGTAPNDEVALQRLKVIAADADDIFPNPEAAIEFLTARPLDGRGRNGIAILREKGLPGIISSLDQRRFGYSG